MKLFYQKRLFSTKTSCIARPIFMCNFCAKIPYYCLNLAFYSCEVLKDVYNSFSLHKNIYTFIFAAFYPVIFAFVLQYYR